MSISRRDVFKPLNNAVTAFRAASSENTEAGTPMALVDNIAEYGVEFLAILAAINLALEMGKDKLVTVEVSPLEQLRDNPNALETFNGDINNLLANLPALRNDLDRLRYIWEDSYHKSRTEAYYVDVTTCTGSGDDEVCITHPEPRTRIVHYWEEPYELTNIGLNHETIDYWLGYISNINSQLSYLSQVAPNVPTFRSREESYEYAPVAVDQNSLNIVRVIGFGSGALAFAFYEEIITFLQNQDGGLTSYLEEGLSKKRIKRRSVLKLASAGVLAYGINAIQQASLSVNSQIQESIFANAKSINDQRDIPAPDAFGRYTGTDVNTLMQTQGSITQMIANAELAGSNSTEDWDSVLPALQQVFNSLQRNINSTTSALQYRDYNEYQIPKSISDAMNNTWAHTQIMQFANGMNAEASNTAVVEVLFALFGILGLSIANETVLALSDRVIDRIKESTEG